VIWRFYRKQSIISQNIGTTKRRPTKRAPDAGDSAAISSSFLRLFIFLAGRLRRPCPSAGNANRWAIKVMFPVSVKRVYPMEQKRNTSKVRDFAIGFFGWIISHNLLWLITFLGLVFLDLNYKIIAAFEILMWLSVITVSFFLFAKKKNWIGVGIIAAFLINVLMLILRDANGIFYGLPALLEGLLNLT